VRHVYYVHGFAAAATSTKAGIIAERLRPAGLEVRCPDFNQPAFETLTATRAITQLDADMATLPPGPVAVIGSSFGGFVALHTAVRQAKQRAATGQRSPWPIDRLVLLAPAFEFGRSSYGTIDAAGVEQWKKTGTLEVFHWGENRKMPVRYALYDDAQQYDTFSEQVPVPALVFQGTRDEAVDPTMVQRYAARQPSVSIRVVDDDHLLMGHIDLIAREVAAFLGVR
jgi:pimeloyl-ACP methyl ester carboxylesterase